MLFFKVGERLEKAKGLEGQWAGKWGWRALEESLYLR